MIKFEKVSQYKTADLPLPERKTAGAAGYDFVVAEDTVVPAYNLCHDVMKGANEISKIYSLDEIASITKRFHTKPTLVPTGMKCYLDEGYYLELSVRSSCPLKYWLILANGVGIIDADYVDNPDNEGHIYFQVINLSPFDIIIPKGSIIGQGVIKRYYITDDDVATGVRAGGFGSTSKE